MIAQHTMSAVIAVALAVAILLKPRGLAVDPAVISVEVRQRADLAADSAVISVEVRQMTGLAADSAVISVK